MEDLELGWWGRWGCGAAVLAGTFTLVTAALTVLDVLSPAWWRSRLLPSTRVPPVVSCGRVARMVPVYVRNVMVSAAYVWLLWEARQSLSPERPAATLWMDARLWPPINILIQIVAIHGMSQLWFWMAHRFVHSHEFLYKFIHAAHHRHTEPFALTAIDCTVSEMLVLNIPAVVLPLLIVQPVLVVQCIWMVLAASYVPLAHSGHNLFADAYHVIHHRDPRFNFGSVTLDRIFNTLKTEQPDPNPLPILLLLFKLIYARPIAPPPIASTENPSHPISWPSSATSVRSSPRQQLSLSKIGTVGELFVLAALAELE